MPQTRTIGVAFVVDEGTRAYIERINIRGNTRTRDYVIRREFDISEGDPYNRALIDRAERRIKNLNFFKTVKITNEPGSAPDRVVINVDVEEQSTGDFSVMGGYSTADGWMAQASVSERNLFGTGRFAKASADLRPIRSRRRTQFRRAVFSRSAHPGGHRSVCAADAWPTAISPTAQKRSAALSNSAFRCARISRCSCAIRCTSSRSSCRRSWTTATTSIRIS